MEICLHCSNDKRVHVHAVQAGIGEGWTVVKLNNDKLPSGLKLDTFEKQVRLGWTSGGHA